MKTFLLLICTVLFFKTCENDTPNPILNQLNGQWKLVKIGIGFPSPQGPTEIQPEYEEILEFNASEGNYTRKKDGKIVEKSGVSVSTDEKADLPMAKLIFENSKTYSFMYFTAAPNYLVLHQSSPLGSTLADGNLFFYEKLK